MVLVILHCTVLMSLGTLKNNSGQAWHSNHPLTGSTLEDSITTTVGD